MPCSGKKTFYALALIGLVATIFTFIGTLLPQGNGADLALKNASIVASGFNTAILVGFGITNGIKNSRLQVEDKLNSDDIDSDDRRDFKTWKQTNTSRIGIMIFAGVIFGLCMMLSVYCSHNSVGMGVVNGFLVAAFSIPAICCLAFACQGEKKTGKFSKIGGALVQDGAFRYEKNPFRKTAKHLEKQLNNAKTLIPDPAEETVVIAPATLSTPSKTSDIVEMEGMAFVSQQVVNKLSLDANDEQPRGRPTLIRERSKHQDVIHLDGKGMAELSGMLLKSRENPKQPAKWHNTEGNTTIEAF